jgi:hypothetical protein
MGEKCTGLRWENLTERDHLEKLGLNGEIHDNGSDRHWMQQRAVHSMWLWTVTYGGLLRTRHDPSLSQKCGEILDFLRNYLASQEGFYFMEFAEISITYQFDHETSKRSFPWAVHRKLWYNLWICITTALLLAGRSENITCLRKNTIIQRELMINN